MRFNPIITEFDDQDAYKFFMQYAVLKHYPEAKVRYKFILRETRTFPDGFVEELREQVDYFKELRFTSAMEKHLKEKLPFFDITYFSYLRSYRYDPTEVKISKNKSGELEILIEGYWHKTIFWEVQLMALISELFFLFTDKKVEVLRPDLAEMPQNKTSIESRLPIWHEKFKGMERLGVKVAEFGTRRRYSKEVQGRVIEEFMKIAPKTIVGTSNIMFARKYGIKAIGTQAHEWFMFHAAKYGVMMANRVGMGRWVDTYKGALGIALSDTYTTDIFFEGFDLLYSKLFDGVRQDSGDPVEFAEKTIKHYTDKNIILPNGLIPKTIVFSDSINSMEKIEKIEMSVYDKIFSSYGIGTWLSNDMGVKPLNMVIKMSEAKPEGMTWRNCVKLSDSKGKYTGDKNTVELYKEELGI